MTPTEVIAKRVQEVRKRHGWSAQRLADAMSAAGVPWERQVVTKLENGQRQNVSAAELLALAYVLDIAPVHLLVPVEDITVTPVPGQEAQAVRVRAWIRGEAPLGAQDARMFFSEVPRTEFAVANRRADFLDAVDKELAAQQDGGAGDADR